LPFDISILSCVLYTTSPSHIVSITDREWNKLQQL